MAKITSNGTFSYTPTGGLPLAVSLGITYTTTGSNSTADIKDINTGSWQPLNTSSLSDMRYAIFDNVSTGSIKIAADNAGTNILAVLAPSDVSVLPWSGSLSLYAKAFTSGSQLQYMVVES